MFIIQINVQARIAHNSLNKLQCANAMRRALSVLIVTQHTNHSNVVYGVNYHHFQTYLVVGIEGRCPQFKQPITSSISYYERNLTNGQIVMFVRFQNTDYSICIRISKRKISARLRLTTFLLLLLLFVCKCVYLH